MLRERTKRKPSLNPIQFLIHHQMSFIYIFFSYITYQPFIIAIKSAKRKLIDSVSVMGTISLSIQSVSISMTNWDSQLHISLYKHFLI